MSRRLAALIALAALSAGCVPVTEPVGDIDKAEPDKGLVGKWTVTKRTYTSGLIDVQTLTVDAPEVKGNPKGLMRAAVSVSSDGTAATLWFTTAGVGKHTYVSVLDGDEAGFGKEGAFAKWKADGKKRYLIFRYVRDGDALTLDWGDNAKFAEVARAAKVGSEKDGLEFYTTPAGWLAKHLDETGPDTIFPGTNVMVLAREKK